MFITYRDDCFEFTGRWDLTKPEYATASAVGTYFDVAFVGETAVLKLDVSDLKEPYGHLWISLDGNSGMTEVTISPYIRLSFTDRGPHKCRVIYKSHIEQQNRWEEPMANCLRVCGIKADAPAELQKDTRPMIEFIGDSITEGVLTDSKYFEGRPANDIDILNRVFQSDVCATYAWRTAEILNMRPIIMGYGSIGLTRGGNGRTPLEEQCYPYNFKDSPISYGEPKCIVIMLGTNDRSKPVEEVMQKYTEILDLLRKLHPSSQIISLSLFCGERYEEQSKMVEEYNKANGTNIAFINTAGWIAPSPIHPLRQNHNIIAELLASKIREILSK